MTGDELKLFKSLQKIIAQELAMEKGFGKVGKAGKQAGKDLENAAKGAETAWGRAASKLADMGPATAVIGAAVTKVLREIDTASEAAAGKVRGSEAGLSKLAQLAETPADFDRLVLRAKRLHGTGATETLDQAANLVFALESAGAGEEEALFGKIGEKKLVDDAAAFAKAAATVRSAMGAEETGEFRDIASKAFGAAKFSPSAADKLLEGAATAAAPAKALALSDEELLAATAVISQVTGDAAQAGTQLKALLGALAKSGKFQGQSLDQIVSDIQSRKLSFGQLSKMLGGEEAVAGLNALTANQELFRQATAETARAQATDAAGRKLGFSARDFPISSSQELRRQENLLELSEERIGAERNLVNAAQAEQRRRLQGEGGLRGRLLGMAASMGTDLSQFFLGDRGTLWLRERLGATGKIQDAELSRKIDRLTEAIQANTTATQRNSAAGQQRPSQTPPRPSSRPQQLGERNSQRE
jgi:hypothetical protein